MDPVSTDGIVGPVVKVTGSRVQRSASLTIQESKEDVRLEVIAVSLDIVRVCHGKPGGSLRSTVKVVDTGNNGAVEEVQVVWLYRCQEL